MFIWFVSDSLESPSLKEIKGILFTEVSQSVIFDTKNVVKFINIMVLN